LFVVVKFSGVVDQVFVTVHAFLLIAWPGIHYITVGQHGATFVRNVEEISMAFLALVILERGIGLLSLFFVIVLFLKEMNEYIFCTVPGLGIEKVKGIVRSRKMAVHAISHETLSVINVSGCFPGVVGKLDLMAGGTELRSGGADHGVIREAEKRKGDDDANDNENGGFEKFFHGCVPAAGY